MVDQSRCLEASQIFRKEPCHEQREITDMLMHVPFAIHRLCFEQHFRFEQQVYHRVDWAVLPIPNFIESVSVGKFDEQVGQVVRDVGVGPSEMFREAFLGQGAEQLPERMPWWDLRSHIPLPNIPNTCELSIPDVVDAPLSVL